MIILLQISVDLKDIMYAIIYGQTIKFLWWMVKPYFTSYFLYVYVWE